MEVHLSTERLLNGTAERENKDGILSQVAQI